MRWMRDVLEATQAYGPPVVGSAACVYVGYRLVRLYKRNSAIAARGAEAAEARKNAEVVLASESSQDPPLENSREITDLTLEELMEEIQSGRLSAKVVLRAYTLKALRVTQKLNCVTEPLDLRMCAAEASAADRKLANIQGGDGGTLGILHGLPVSIKENLNVAGMYSTLGLVKRTKAPVTDDAVICRVLRAHGAIPFVKTNVPQTLISFDCSNPIYKATRNPHDLTRTPGGSSGGESALIAAGGSILGIGTDIGGSVRIPAAFCGICALKPTAGRLSGVGITGLFTGQTGVAYSPGVMARDVSGCQLLMKALCTQEMYNLDASLVPIKWNEDRCQAKRRLRIGYFLTTPYFEATPAVQRAVREARDALESAGHELVEFEAPDFYELMSLYYSLIVADGFDTVMAEMDNDCFDPSVKYGARLLLVPKVVRCMTAFLLKHTWHRMSSLLLNIEKKSVQELWTLQARCLSTRQKFYTSVREKELDGFICPAHAIGPLPLGTAASLTASASYTAVFNLLNMPAGVVPVTRATEEDEASLDAYPHRDLWGMATKRHARGMAGLPMTVQCVTLPWQDEECVAIMSEVESSLRKMAK